MRTSIDPNELLGNEIFEALAESGLINKEESPKLLALLVSGSVNDSDWKLALETAIRTHQNQPSDEAERTGN